MNNQLLERIYQHVLTDHMGNDPRSMAMELRMTEKTIDNALKNPCSEEYALLFEQLLSLCAERGISVDAILKTCLETDD